MRTKLLLAGVSILILPFLLSPSDGNKLANAAPFVSVAYAGHTTLGDWCGCGAPGCICDPGEILSRAKPISDAPSAQPKPRTKEGRGSELDFGAGALLIAVALFMWTRLRS